MNPGEFVAKWRPVELRERQACQEHFIDLCRLVGHPTPVEMDPVGDRFCFERGASKTSGGDGWADAWKRGYFGWEYKGKHKNLGAAYKQLNDYREDLENPPLLVVCDMDRIEVHTNFTNTEARVLTLTFEDLATPEGMRVLRAVFFDPESLRPSAQRVEITRQVAGKIGELAQALRDRGIEPHAAARFLDRVVFCMFAEDVGLLRKGLFTGVLGGARQDPKRLRPMLEALFGAMAGGGFFGTEEIRRFNGNLFNEATVLDLPPHEIALLDAAAKPDWSDVEPAIFGSLFERGLDPDKRSQIGAHYTSREDIETLVEPVVMQPLRREWNDTREMVLNVLATGKKRPNGGEKPPVGKALDKARREVDSLVRNFLDRLATVKVLDPACGSGNFLYVTLQGLMGLEREVLSFAAAHDVPSFIPRVDPLQLHGIEINAYAFELAQMTVWIGYLQALNRQGFHLPDDPVLKPMDSIQCRDAILDLSDPEHPKEPVWPVVDYIVGNPPFLGGKLLRRGLGDDYVDKLFALWDGRVRREADLCCYWFEKARRHIEAKLCLRAGLLATQGIRGGANRKVLEYIKETGEIFFAVSDRKWILDGASVHVSMVAFDDGSEDARTLDGAGVAAVNADLTFGVDATAARPLTTNLGLCFMGDTKGGNFELEGSEALDLLNLPNPHGRPNSDVLVPWVNGLDVTQRHRSMWIIDFGTIRGEVDAALYEAPFALVRERVAGARASSRTTISEWWRHERPRTDMRAALAPLPHFIATARVTKHRLFVWLTPPTLADSQVFTLALASEAALGVLHARAHEVWARRQGTQLRERESGFRYTPTTCFETFPFPWPPGSERSGDPLLEAIARAAHELNDLRERWLNPPEWVSEEVLEFPGSVDGPWARFVQGPDGRGIGTVRWPRLVPRDAQCAAKLKTRTLTNLYNQRPTWLALAHEKLDAAVFASYGWDPAISNEQLLESLLALNLERAKSGGQ
jgi:hypothetical protein